MKLFWGIKEKTKINKTSTEDIFIVSFSKEWAKYTYSISLYSLLIRIGQFYKNDIDPIKYIETFSAFDADVYLVKQNVEKIKTLCVNGFVHHDMKIFTRASDVHNFGINALYIKL